MVSPFSFDRDGTGQQSLTLLLLECLYIFLLVLVSFYILLEYFLSTDQLRVQNLLTFLDTVFTLLA